MESHRAHLTLLKVNQEPNHKHEIPIELNILFQRLISSIDSTYATLKTHGLFLLPETSERETKSLPLKALTGDDLSQVGKSARRYTSSPELYVTAPVEAFLMLCHQVKIQAQIMLKETQRYQEAKMGMLPSDAMKVEHALTMLLATLADITHSFPNNKDNFIEFLNEEISQCLRKMTGYFAKNTTTVVKPRHIYCQALKEAIESSPYYKLNRHDLMQAHVEAMAALEIRSPHFHHFKDNVLGDDDFAEQLSHYGLSLDKAIEVERPRVQEPQPSRTKLFALLASLDKDASARSKLINYLQTTINALDSENILSEKKSKPTIASLTLLKEMITHETNDSIEHLYNVWQEQVEPLPIYFKEKIPKVVHKTHLQELDEKKENA